MCFPALSKRKNAKDRIVSPQDVVAAEPDIIVGSWCGKKFVPAKVAARPGFSTIPAVRDGFLREIKSPLILQPGPAALTDGLEALVGIVTEWAKCRRRRSRSEPILVGETMQPSRCCARNGAGFMAES